MQTPQMSGIWGKSRLMAMAEPSTSARSHAAMAISQTIQSAIVVGREKLSRHACARSRPLAMPRRAASACSRIAIRFEMMMTLSRVYPKRAPPAMSVAQLPGSM